MRIDAYRRGRGHAERHDDHGRDAGRRELGKAGDGDLLRQRPAMGGARRGQTALSENAGLIPARLFFRRRGEEQISPRRKPHVQPQASLGRGSNLRRKHHRWQRSAARCSLAAPTTPYGSPISLDAAKKAMAAAEAEAVKNNWPMAIVILNSTGHTVMIHELDNTQYGSI